ncbi:MAG: hypothetical protein ACK4MG_14230 [Aquabacterium sp.]|uniref:hypothetical protein n=1 Tax=uncultured Aquabacterium sp. TaxID=158753 RepID=UPI0025DB4E11|nr:hypothetical protein [uncultured Aquabacterium sp.]
MSKAAFPLSDTQAALASPGGMHLSVLSFGAAMTVCGEAALRELRRAIDCALGETEEQSPPLALALAERLAHVAAIAHMGGLAGLSEADALIDVRKLTAEHIRHAPDQATAHNKVELARRAAAEAWESRR